jgi:nucleotide-binding universal stress UspA family protein
VIFDRMICGVEPSEQSLEAVRQSARLVSGTGRLLLLGVVELDLAVHAGWAASHVIDQLRSDAETALERAHREIAHLRLAETRLVEGPAPVRFQEEIVREKATLLCLGIHGRHRATGILLGTLATTLLHDAPCSVLIARPPRDPTAFPSSVVVGVDGSQEARTAADVAVALGERYGASVRTIVAAGGKDVDLDALGPHAVAGEQVPGKPVDVLVKASAEADLLVIGSRGLHGLRSLGSVSERVAHEARCSVLVVR